MRHILTTTLLCATLWWMQAQNDLNSLVLTDSWQQLQTNPALQPEGLLVGLPGLYANSWWTNITYNDIVTTQGGNTFIDVDAAIAQLGDNNILRQDLDLETIGLGFHIGKIGLHLGHRVRFNAVVDYPKTLAQLIWQGNAQFIGQTIDFAPAFDMIAYHEISAGVSLPIGENIHIGGRVKLLSGTASLQTERNRLELTTSDDIYQLEMLADYRINSAGTLIYNGLREDVQVDINGDDILSGAIFGENTGLAFDAGISAQFGKLQLAASAVDIGASIEWKTDVKNYTLDGVYAYEGLDVAQALLDGEEELGSVLDSLYNTYEPVETSTGYTTRIGGKYFFSGQYEVSDEITVGVVGYSDSYRHINSQAVALTGSVVLAPWLKAGMLWGLRNERLDNVGAHAVVKLGPCSVIVSHGQCHHGIPAKGCPFSQLPFGAKPVLRPRKESMGEPSGDGRQFF
ncbi:MAG: DUF5723 family protein [Saprospiraceae bacterium]